ncbi:hypothetical protein HDV05_005907 [Chytridiales sp. JEL 0842]|nr:hypothetical protein HDV05_005907 [Chytridiales sp. JEL 0842]
MATTSMRMQQQHLNQSQQKDSNPGDSFEMMNGPGLEVRDMMNESDAISSTVRPQLEKESRTSSKRGDNQVQRGRKEGSAGDYKVVTVVKSVPATNRFPVPEDVEEFIPNPGVPRATVAPSKEHPNGSTDSPNPNLTVLQQHVAYWDPKGKGVIWPWDTFWGFYKIGFNIFLSLWAVTVVNGGFSFFSQDSWIPNPLFPIYTKNIHRCKHGSDSGTYDTEGRYLPQRFEEIFSKYASHSPQKDYLTFADIWALSSEIRNVMDFFGWFANKFEWIALWLIAADNEGRLRKEDVRRCFDGTLFYHLEARRNKELERRRGEEEKRKVARKAEKERRMREKETERERREKGEVAGGSGSGMARFFGGLKKAPAGNNLREDVHAKST